MTRKQTEAETGVSSAFKAVLSWPGDPDDLDLHVVGLDMDDDGCTTVDYADKECRGVTLDRDNVKVSVL